MTRIRRALACLTFFAVLPLALPNLPSVHAAGGNPAIRITNLRDGQVVTGNAITVQVSVSNFKLVPPVYINPPKLTGNQGHIHYVLDSLANFKPRRDATIALSHTWTGVTPGRHVVEAYLATSQHAQFASAQPVKVAITVRPGSATSPTAPTKPGVVSAPRSGGAAGVSRDVYPPALTLIGALAMLLGLLVLAGQLLHKSTGRRVP